jgi:hypothetical protein
MFACQMRSLVAGMSRPLTPIGASASTTALTIAGSAPTVPASPRATLVHRLVEKLTALEDGAQLASYSRGSGANRRP